VRFEGAQDLRLAGGAELADLVEQQGAAVGQLELAGEGGDGAGERAAFVAEQLAFHQRLGDRRAVQRHQRTRGAPARAVQHEGGALLAGAGLAADQHRRLAAGQPADQRAQRGHRGTVADQLARGRA
jgi:hypothetical protein